MQLQHVTGHDNVIRNLDLFEQRIQNGLTDAAIEIGYLLEQFAQQHHGKTPRKSGMVWNPLTRKRFFRPGGVGWGDVTLRTQRATRAGIVNRTRTLVVIMLSAGMDYDLFLETIKNGKWSWLWPTMLSNKTTMLRIFQKHLKVN